MEAQMANTLEQRRDDLRNTRKRNIFFNTVCVLLIFAALFVLVRFFWRHVNYEVTNDAYVDQYIVPVNVRVSGYIKEVRFTEHQFVHEGDTLLLLDDREFKIKVDDAQANLDDAIGAYDVLEASLIASKTNVDIQQANIDELKANLEQYSREMERYALLSKKEAISYQQYEQAKARYDAGIARLNSLKSQKYMAEVQYDEQKRSRKSAEAAMEHRKAELALAALDLSYAAVTAPFDGYMGRRALEEGQYVQAGQSISNISDGKDKWITANYLETQIPEIYVGQKVRIKVDAYKNKLFFGTVTAISGATGSKYSLVPTDNSAGNFVKIQQRIPVRIDFDSMAVEDLSLLRAGMMVETEAVKR